MVLFIVAKIAIYFYNVLVKSVFFFVCLYSCLIKCIILNFTFREFQKR